MLVINPCKRKDLIPEPPQPPRRRRGRVAAILAAASAALLLGYLVQPPREVAAVIATKSGSITDNGDVVLLNAPPTGNECGIQITGTWTGTISFEGSINGRDFFAIPAIPPTTGAPTAVSSTIVNGKWIVPASSYSAIRCRATAAITGTATVFMLSAPGASAVMVYSPISATITGTSDVNLAQVAGVATKTGSGTATGVVRVELPTNGTGVVGLNAGANLIGSAAIDQTTPGTTNRVAVISGQNGIAAGTGVDGATVPRVTLATNVGLPAGSAIIGKTGIDQTTPGTTNAVAPISGQAGVAGGSGVVGATVQRVVLATDVGLPAGTALLGKTGIDQTTPGTTNAVAPISGQAGVAGGAGAVGATVQRVTLASDDPLNAKVGAAAALADATANPTIGGLSAFNFMFNGTTWDRLKGTTAGGLWVQGNVASGVASTANPVLGGTVYTAAGVTPSNGQQVSLQSDAGGRLISTLGTALSSSIDSIWASTEGQKATYSTTASRITTVATATDIFTLTGSASKTIRVLSVRVTFETTAAAGVYVILAKHTTADTGGTSSAPTIAPHDSNSAAATATPLSYTGNPTVGTAVTIDAGYATSTILGTATVPIVEFRRTWTANNDQAIVLRGVAQQFAVNLAGDAVPTGSKFSVAVTWSEE